MSDQRVVLSTQYIHIHTIKSRSRNRDHDNEIVQVTRFKSGQLGLLSTKSSRGYYDKTYYILLGRENVQELHQILTEHLKETSDEDVQSDSRN